MKSLSVLCRKMNLPVERICTEQQHVGVCVLLKEIKRNLALLVPVGHVPLSHLPCSCIDIYILNVVTRLRVKL